MSHLSKELLLNWTKEAQCKVKNGKLPDYIPLLQQVDPHAFSLYILGSTEEVFSIGDVSLTFPLMSVIKPFLLFYLLANLGQEKVFKNVGKQPSNYPFNSLKQLQQDNGFPRNPMINSGAIMLSSLIEGETEQIRCQNLCKWLNKMADCQLFLDPKMLNSVQSQPNPRNQALVKQLVTQNNLQKPDITLETYNSICCLSGTVIDVAKLGLLLINPADSQLEQYSQIVQEIMTTCGLYEASQAFKEKVNFPTKSGVSGVILSLILQQKRAFACYSPFLDSQGNSIAGLYLLEKMAESK